MSFLLKPYYERKRDKVIFVSKLTDKIHRLSGGTYIKEGAKKVRYDKINYLLGETFLLSKFGKRVHFFDIDNCSVLGNKVLKQVGMTKEELDAYTNGGVIATLKNFMKKSVSDWLLVLFAFIAGAGVMSIISGMV